MKKITNSRNAQTPDVISGLGDKWLYSKIVKNHFLRPRNFVSGGKPKFKFNGVGMVGSPACGDMMKIWIYVDPKTEKIKS